MSIAFGLYGLCIVACSAFSIIRIWLAMAMDSARVIPLLNIIQLLLLLLALGGRALL